MSGCTPVISKYRIIRIDNRRQSVICATIHYSLVISCLYFFHTNDKDGHKVHVEGSVSQNFDLGPRFISMSKSGKLFVNFSNFIF